MQRMSKKPSDNALAKRLAELGISIKQPKKQKKVS